MRYQLAASLRQPVTQDERNHSRNEWILDLVPWSSRQGGSWKRLDLKSNLDFKIDLEDLFQPKLFWAHTLSNTTRYRTQGREN